MTFQIGDVNFTKEIAELWFELVKTQNILETVLNKVSTSNPPDLPNFLLSDVELKQCEEKAFSAVRNRFPSLNIKRN